MKKYNLGFISDEDIFNHVKNTVEGYRFETNLKTFNKNLIDPIKMTFDSKVYGIDIIQGIENEVIRQVDKTNSNLIGYFHQNIFKYINKDWTVPKQGFDVINDKIKIFVEMKNKHNTMNANSSQKTYINMQSKILSDDKAVCMLVEVIAKNSQDIPWVITVDGKQLNNKRIRRVSIDKFYEIVTGDKNAFKRLCEILPDVIDDVVSVVKGKESINSVIEELKLYSENILKSLYMLSFEKYNGFDSFDLK